MAMHRGDVPHLTGNRRAIARWLEGSKLGGVVPRTGCGLPISMGRSLLVGGVLAAFVLFHAVNNWRWLTSNVTILGWDVPSHLGTSFIYDSILHPFSLRTLFTAITWHPNRPPLFFLSTVPLYRLFGVSTDVGTMVNVLYLAVLIGSVYGIGQRLGGRRVGLLAAFVVATLPMVYALSRFYYLELALTAMVALSIYLLLASERFENRAVSLLFGLSFGLGLLTKRTYLAFMLAPLCLVVARSDVLKSLVQRRQAGFRLDVKDALLALALGLVLAAAWYLPAREIASQLPLGVWLLPLWALLAAATIYLLRRKPGPDTNLLSALFLGATLGSLWYLPRITFLQRLLSFGFGLNDPRERSANLDDLGTYAYFLVRLVNEHISLVTFALLLAAVLGLLLTLRRKGRIWHTLRRASDAWWVTVLWVLAAYLIFTFSIYRKSRGIAPVLPALALILAAGLFRLPWKNVVALLVVLVIGWGLVQFATLSYEGPHWLAERTAFNLPLLGETGVFARGGTLQLPASGETDRGYWVLPDILRFVDAERQMTNAEAVKLGVVANDEHANPDLFGLLALQSYPGIQVRNLSRIDAGGSVYSELFEQDYLVLIDYSANLPSPGGVSADSLLVDAAAQEALHRLYETPGFFESTFELAQRFPLPDGDAVLLYRKARQLAPGYDIEDYRAVARTITGMAQAGDAILLVPPEQVAALGRSYDGDLPPYLLPRTQPLNAEGTAHALETARTLAGITSQHPVLFVVFREEEAVDPERFVEDWLNEHAYRSQTEWHGGVRLVVYGAPLAHASGTPSHAEETEHPLDVRLGEQIRILGYSVAGEAVEPGRMVRLTLSWQAEATVTERLAVFAHLLNAEGKLVAQQDGEPQGGSRPTTTWAAGEVIRDQIGILVPADAAEGEYQLVVGMYQPDTGERLPVVDLDGVAVGDAVLLGTIQLLGSE